MFLGKKGDIQIERKTTESWTENISTSLNQYKTHARVLPVTKVKLMALLIASNAMGEPFL